MQTVSTEARDRTLIVTIERPQARNAVDGPTAQQLYDAFKADRKSTRLNSSHPSKSRMPSSA